MFCRTGEKQTRLSCKTVWLCGWLFGGCLVVCFGCVVWLCGLVVWFGCVVWLCGLAVWFGCVVWLCGLAGGLVVWLAVWWLLQTVG